ncbi:MAG TPA: hypothetical protein IGS52_21215 [Oscillatoriaceae cyanobacterium M33_DOE_052]|uniref:Uncharacterized protein n=1 Tax=Planktothricoides sp. SpSt-374 TaxID=2282167 RepID=A0A7C3ZIS4_9CYAN|nr:hypothetical protein [Oscillatoriaceae cyanobacterium M33_DOE_052]
MSQQVPKDEERLGAFLRRHCPEAPTASPELEERIFAAVTAQPLTPRRRWRLLESAVVAGLLLAAAGYTWQQKFAARPPATPPTAAELARLEAFLESSWDGLLYPEETLPATFPPP